MTEDEAARRRAQWRDGDEALQREFQEFARQNSDYRWAEPGDDADPAQDLPPRRSRARLTAQWRAATRAARRAAAATRQ